MHRLPTNTTFYKGTFRGHNFLKKKKKTLCLTNHPLCFSWIWEENIYSLLNPKWKDNLEKPCPASSISLTFLATVTKCLTQPAWRRKVLWLSLRVSSHGFHHQPIKTGKARGRSLRWLVMWHPESGSKERGTLSLNYFLHFIQSGIPVRRMGLPSFRVNLRSSVKHFWKHPEACF